MDQEAQELLLDFVHEARESLDLSEPILAQLETSANLAERLDMVNSVFRMFHTLKGGAGFLQLDNVKELTHAAENLLQIYRKSPQLLLAHHIDVFQQSSDLTRKMLEKVEQENNDKGFEQPVHALITKLVACVEEVDSSVGLPHLQASATEKEKVATVAEITQSKIAKTSTSKEPELQINFAITNFDIGPEIRQSFHQEAEELLQKAEDILIVMEKLNDEVEAEEYLNTAFRCLHTIKGNAGFLNLEPLEKLAHAAESILESLKDNKMTLNSTIVQSLLKAIDTLRQGSNQIVDEKPLDIPAFQIAIKLLKNLVPNKEKPLGEILVHMGVASSDAVERALEQQQKPLGQILIDMGEVEEKELEKALGHQGQPATISHAATGDKAEAGHPAQQRVQDIRVNLKKIDELMNLVGELVISEAMLFNNPEIKKITALEAGLAQLNKNVRDLQEVAMSVRMVPVSATFRKMIRVVRDVSKKVGKQVELHLIGEETEMDKTVVEQIADPLLHIIRNAVDHGIDTPQERSAAAKPPMGKIFLEARNAGNEVWIVIQDDGRGLNTEKILQKAKEKNLIAADANPTNEEIWKMIFLPGFSTTEKLTDLSGRGVGMDVVKRNIEQLNGRIDISSKHGAGSTFTLRIPLTLAIIEGMLVRVGQSRYAIPIGSIRESFKPLQKDITHTSADREIVKIREELLPVLRLHKIHGIPADHAELSNGILVVIEDNHSRACLFLDEVLGDQQIVVKALPKSFGRLPHLSGCTILGDGGIALILNVESMVQAMRDGG